eukprot:6214083-Amphidinium_carterae.1
MHALLLVQPVALRFLSCKSLMVSPTEEPLNPSSAALPPMVAWTTRASSCMLLDCNRKLHTTLQLGNHLLGPMPQERATTSNAKSHYGAELQPSAVKPTTLLLNQGI